MSISPSTNKIIITGGSSDVGFSMAKSCLNSNFTPVLIGRDLKRLKSNSLKLSKIYNTQIEYVVLDLNNLKSVQKFIKTIKQQKNIYSGLITCAGVWHSNKKAYYGKHLDDISDYEIIEVINVGLISHILLSKAIIGLIGKNKTGRIINISGTFTEHGKNWAHYYIAKKGIENLTLSLAQEVIDTKTTVNCISPADIATLPYKKFFPADAKTALKPEDLIPLCDHLLSENGKNINGQIIEIRRKI